VKKTNLDHRLCLPKAVLQLAWRPVIEDAGEEGWYDLAVAGEDSSLRIYKVKGL
jgi:elongator complex protein 2